jgi:hypothetical protein
MGWLYLGRLFLKLTLYQNVDRNGEATQRNFVQSGTDVMILKIFLPKKLAKILALLAQTTASFCKNLIITLVFEKNANFFAKIGKNRRKL